MGKIKMPLPLMGENIIVPNGQIKSYQASTADIEPNTFVEFVTSGGVTKVKRAASVVNGLTKSKCTTSSAGKVWVL